MLQAYLRVLLIYLSRAYTEQFQYAERSRIVREIPQADRKRLYSSLHDVASNVAQYFARHLDDVIKQQSDAKQPLPTFTKGPDASKRLLFRPLSGR